MPFNPPPKYEWVYGDFNGMLDTGLLCLSHEDTVKRPDGSFVELTVGLSLITFDEDLDNKGRRDDLFVSGVVESLASRGAREGRIHT